MDDSSTDDLTSLQMIDEIADRFESEWSAELQPRIEDFLAGSDPEIRPKLLSELLAIELEWRVKRNLKFSFEEYQERFPESVEIIQGALSSLQQSPVHVETGEVARSTVITSHATNSSVPNLKAPGQVAASDAEFPVPKSIGRYRIIKQLGAGAMGMVYQAEDDDLRRQVAVKIPKLDFDQSGDLAERFQREARAAATLNHPNICAVYDIGETDGVPYITMAYVDGHSLQNVIGKGRQQPARQAALLIRKLAMALQAAHEQGVVHRDLKPANIMIDKKKQPVIMDFGLALLVDREGDARLTQSGMILGSPAYMSPEQVSGDPNAVGPQSDIYSLGVILYQLLAGRLPYLGGVLAVVSQIQQADPPSVREFVPEIDKELTRILEKMMARSLSARYSSMREVATDLSSWLKGETPRTATESLRNRPVQEQLRIDVVVPPRKKRGTIRRTTFWKQRSTLIATATLFSLLFFGVIFIINTAHGRLQIEVNDPRIGLEVDGEKLTLTDLKWDAKKRAGKHELQIIINGKPVPIGESLPIMVDGQGHRLVASLENADLMSNEFRIQRGTTTAIKIQLLAHAANVPPVANVPQAAAPVAAQVAEPPSASPAFVAANFRSLVRKTPAYENNFLGEYVIQNLDHVFSELKGGRLGIKSKFPRPSHSNYVYWNRIRVDQGLIEVDVKGHAVDSSWCLALANTRLPSQVFLSVIDGALRADLYLPEGNKSLKLDRRFIAFDLPLLDNGGFDKIQLMLHQRTIDVAINGQRVGETIQLPFSIASSEFTIGYALHGSNADVEYERLAYYPILGEIVPPLSQEKVPAERKLAAGEEVDLMTGYTLEQMYRTGPWEVTGDGFVCGAVPVGHRRLELPIRPFGDYDLEVEITSGVESNFMMRLPVGETGSTADFTVSAYGGEAMGIVVQGLVSKDLPEPIGRSPSPIQVGKRHKVVAQVRKTDLGWSITGLVDGEQMVHWEGEPSELTLHIAWDSGDLSRPLLGQWITSDATLTIHSARLKVISQSAHLMPEPSR